MSMPSGRRRGCIDYHIEVNGGFYSVPSALVRQSVDVRLSAHTVEIRYGANS